MPISEIGARANYAEEIHPDKALSSLIQRSLEGPRARHIADYLALNKERFFNSLVLATYGGSPDWLEVGNFRATSNADIVDLISDSAMNALGFLKLAGDEKIFAIDGQHRLAGIKRAISDGIAIDGEVVPIILVGHKRTATGMQRTRRLFTTLNKTAVPVRKRDIIALDEDDVMAITVRRLVEGNPWFRDPKIAVIASQNIPSGNRTSLTTISNLYDVLKLVFMHASRVRIDRSLRFNRPSDERLEEFYEAAVNFFAALANTFKPIRDLLDSNQPGKITEMHRGDHGGHILFRPIGLEIFTRAAIDLAISLGRELPDVVYLLQDLPTALAEPPYRNVIWDSSRKAIITRGKSVARDVIKYMLGLEVNVDKLSNDYALAVMADLGSREARLPKRIRNA